MPRRVGLESATSESPLPPSSSNNSNSASIALLVAGKVFGVVGLALGGTDYRVLGGVLLAFDGILLVTAAVLAMRGMKRTAREETDQKQILKRMVREGTLQQYLRDLESDRPSGPLPS